LKSARNSAFDRFVAANGLPSSPAQGEEVRLFARRVLGRLSELESARGLKLVPGFDQQAFSGFRVFLASNGETSRGNCVVCHAPPSFSDYSFHNMGVSQAEYEAVHGQGSFDRLVIPGAAATRPSTEFRETPSLANPRLVDLGYWNFVDPSSSPLRREGESEERFLSRMIATFKTPTLRNLAYSHPYLHNGAFSTVEQTVFELKRLSDL